jgi:hypothetical protein
MAIARNIVMGQGKVNLIDRNCDPGASRGFRPTGAEIAPDIGELTTRSTRICSSNLGNAELNQFWVRTTADVNPNPELGQVAREARDVGTGRSSDNVGSGIVADSLLAYGTPDRVLTKGFLGALVQHTRFTFDAETRMGPRPNHHCPFLLDELLLQKQGQNGFLPKLQQTSVATQGKIDESTPLVETTLLDQNVPMRVKSGKLSERLVGGDAPAQKFALSRQAEEPRQQLENQPGDLAE